jgi:segregation and condensation protein B
MQLKTIVEGALLAAGRPLSLAEIADLFDLDKRPGSAELRAAIAELRSDYEGRGVELAEISTGFRLQVRRELGPWISRLWEEKPVRYSRALLETLALIAYRQPITRGDIEEVRGVSVNPNIIRTLQEREWVRVVGHRDVPGKPELLATTRTFLDYFGLKSLDELPTLAEIKDFDQVNPEMELDIEERESAAGEAVAGETESAEAVGDAASAGPEADAEDAGEAADETAAAPPREEIAALDADRQ